MLWHNHSKIILPGSHAIFSPSAYHWLNYDTNRAVEYVRDSRAKERGTRLHAFACDAIKLRQTLGGKTTVSMYVNDCIKYGMDPEVQLYYSPNFFGTTDAITIDRGKLRISDLKTGTKVTPSMKQLLIYDALYCYDYGVDPRDIDHELRIYFKDERILEKPKASDIMMVMDKMRELNSAIEEMEDDYGLL